MKRICFFLMVFLASASSLLAQELSGDSPWENNDSPWENNASQTSSGAGARGSSTTSTNTGSASNTMRLPTKPTTQPTDPKITGQGVIAGTPAPIDGGLVALLAAGALYGGKKLRRKNKQIS